MSHTLPIEPEAAEWVEENIMPEMRIFEYGSGASTLYFSKKVGTHLSVEHNPRKFQKVHALLGRKKGNIKLIEPEKTTTPFPYSHISYGSADKEFDHYSFENYVNHIKEYDKFDVIFINGRSRASCIWVAASEIKTGGFLILNDSERYEYQNAKELFLKRYPRQVFGEGSRKTTVWTLE